METASTNSLALWKPSTSLSIEQEAAKSKATLRLSTSPQQALTLTKRLLGAWPHANPPDPVGYARSIAETLAQFPLGLVEECCDPVRGLARTREFPPTVAAVTEWCERRLKQHQGMVRWGEKKAAERPEFPPEHRARMLQRWQELLRSLWQKPQQEAAE